MKKINYFIIPVLAIFALFMNGCKDSVTNPESNVSISQMSVAEPLPGDNDVLVLNEVKVMIKHMKIEFKNSTGDKDIKVGPFVINVNMNGTVSEIAPAVYVNNGTYSKVKFKVHRLEDNENIPDPDFVDNQGRYSVIVKGTYNGLPFVYKSKVDAEQKLNLPADFVVSDSFQNITLRVSPYLWFIENGMYLNPMIPEDAKEIDNNIKENIKDEMKCYRDNNKDGDPD